MVLLRRENSNLSTWPRARIEVRPFMGFEGVENLAWGFRTVWTSRVRSVIRFSQSQGFRLGERYIFAALEQNLLLLLA